MGFGKKMDFPEDGCDKNETTACLWNTKINTVDYLFVDVIA